MCAPGLRVARQAGAQKPEASLLWASAVQVAHAATSLAWSGEGPNERGRGRRAGLLVVAAAGAPEMPRGFMAGERASASFRVRPRPSVGKGGALLACGQVLRLRLQCLAWWAGMEVEPPTPGQGKGWGTQEGAGAYSHWAEKRGPGLAGIRCALTMPPLRLLRVALCGLLSPPGETCWEEGSKVATPAFAHVGSVHPLDRAGLCTCRHRAEGSPPRVGPSGMRFRVQGVPVGKPL